MLDRETESKKSPPRGYGHTPIPSPPFSSQDLGHTRTHAQREFKPPSPGIELRLTTWESSDIAVTLFAVFTPGSFSDVLSYVAQACFELPIPSLLICWDFRHMPPWLALRLDEESNLCLPCGLLNSSINHHLIPQLSPKAAFRASR